MSSRFLSIWVFINSILRQGSEYRRFLKQRGRALVKVRTQTDARLIIAARDLIAVADRTPPFPLLVLRLDQAHSRHNPDGSFPIPTVDSDHVLVDLSTLHEVEGAQSVNDDGLAVCQRRDLSTGVWVTVNVLLAGGWRIVRRGR
jgi:hypothetical protein